jgi:5'-nucleotidase (lipoprotein e(P4) family)
LDASAARDGEHKGLIALAGLKLRPDDLQVDVFRDTAVATFTMVATISSGASAITKSERGTLVFAKHEGSWKIVHEHFSASNDPKSDAELTSEESLLSVLWYQHAAECRALYYQACNIARERVDERLAWRRAHPEEARPAAIIVDIDETILDNSPYNGWLIRNHTNYQWATFENWVNATNAIALPGIVGLLRHCESSNVAVFYVSNRKATNDVLKNTIANLKAQGLPYADADHVRLRTGPESKDDRRDPILKSHDVILLMGDNLADFHHAYDITDPSGASNRLARTDLDAKLFGTRYIPLPNPMYGSWENALYAVTNKTKSAVRHKELRAFEPKEK